MTTNANLNYVVQNDQLAIGELNAVNFQLSGNLLSEGNIKAEGNIIGKNMHQHLRHKPLVELNTSRQLLTNTRYKMTSATGLNCSLPLTAEVQSKIIVEFHVSITVGQTFRFGNAGVFLSPHSVMIQSAITNIFETTTTVADGTTAFHKIVGVANATTPGSGSIVEFTFTEDLEWSIYSNFRVSGNGVAAGSNVFTNTP